MNGLRVQLYRMAAAATLVAGAPLFAQSVSDFRLPAGQASPAPRAQGPVDPETPRVPPAATPSSAAAPPPVPTISVPAPAPSAVPVHIPRPARNVSTPAASAPATAGNPAARGRAAPVPAASPLPKAGAEAALPVPSSAPTPAPAAAPDLAQAPAPAEAPVAAPAASGFSAWWWLLGLGGVAALGAFVFARRRAAAGPAEENAAEIRAAGHWAGDAGEAAPPPAPMPVAAPVPEPVAAPEPPPIPAVPPVAAAAPEAPVMLALDPVRLSISLVNATLHYELSLANFTPTAIGPLAIAADMIGAHASMPAESQLGQDGAGLELRHEVPGLAPGETLRLKGELRLPLATVQPIRSGAATLLVPLVRLRAEAQGWSMTRVVVVGEAPLAPGGLLRPFRLDTGPRIFGAVEQREVARAA